jgi:hypothetical protein
LQIVFPNPFQPAGDPLDLWSSGALLLVNHSPLRGSLFSRALPVDQSSTDYVPILKAHWKASLTPSQQAKLLRDLIPSSTHIGTGEFLTEGNEMNEGGKDQ